MLQTHRCMLPTHPCMLLNYPCMPPTGPYMLQTYPCERTLISPIQDLHVVVLEGEGVLVEQVPHLKGGRGGRGRAQHFVQDGNRLTLQPLHA